MPMTFFRLTAIPVLAATLLAGCIGGGGNRVRYYLVNPVDVLAMETETSRPLAIEVIDVHLPQYLERFQIVTRDGDNRLRMSDTNQWGENLRKNLMRTLMMNLSGMLSTIDIGTPLNRCRISVCICTSRASSATVTAWSGCWHAGSSATRRRLNSECTAPISRVTTMWGTGIMTRW